MKLILVLLSSCCALLLAVGLWQLCCAVLLHDRSTVGRKAMKKLMEKKQKKKLDLWSVPAMQRLSRKLSPHIPLDDMSKEELEKKLRRIELDITAEEYTARRYIIFAFGILAFGLCACARSFLFMIPTGLITAYFIVQQKELVEGAMRLIVKDIQLEMPRFVRTVCQLLMSNRDIPAALTSYRKVAGATLGKELDSLLLAIQTGSVTTALYQFQNRIGTDEVYRLCSALIEMERGIDQTSTLQNLAEDMAQKARLNIQKELALRPGKMQRTYVPAALFCGAMLIYSLIVYFLAQLNAVL